MVDRGIVGVVAMALGCGGCVRSMTPDDVDAQPLEGEQDAADAEGISHVQAPNLLGAVTALGDVDGDGFDDVAVSVVTNDPSRCEQVHLVYGRPLALARHDVLLATAAAAWECGAKLYAVADVDDDGLADVVVQHADGLYLYAGRRDRWSGEVAQSDAVLLVAGAGEAIRAGDVDGDGANDLWLRSASAGELGLFRGPLARDALPLQPNTAFASILDDDPAGSWDAHGIGDLDGDGRDDLALKSVSELVIFHGTAEAGRPRSMVDADAWITAESGGIQFFHGRGDLHGDGIDDLVVVVDGIPLVVPGATTRRVGEIAVELEPLAGADVFATDIPGAVLGDIDGDGRDDLAVGVYHDGHTSDVGQDMLVAYGSRSFSARPTLRDADALLRAELEYYWDIPEPVGDFNGDGFADFVLPSTSMVIGDEDYRSVMHLVYGAPRE